MKQTMKFRSRYECGRNAIFPSCPASEALCHLMNVKIIETRQLPFIHELGFNIEIIPDSKELSKEFKRDNVNYDIAQDGAIKLNP